LTKLAIFIALYVAFLIVGGYIVYQLLKKDSGKPKGVKALAVGLFTAIAALGPILFFSKKKGEDNK
jgi:hypothetical protein